MVYYSFGYKNKIIKILNGKLYVRYIFFLNFVLLFSYIIWINATSYLRYFILFEFLSGIYIISSLMFILCSIVPKIQKIIILFLTCFILFSTKYTDSNMNRLPFNEKFLDIKNLNLPDASIVLQCGGYPSAIFIPFNNPKARWIYLYGELWDFNFKYPEKEEQKIKELISTYNNDKIFLIYSEFEPAIVPWDYIGQFVNINNFSCNKINPKEPTKNFYLCSYKSNVVE